MVAGDHLDADTGCTAFGDGGYGFLPRRIDQADEAEEGEAAGKARLVDLVGFLPSLGKRQDAQPAQRHRLGTLVPMIVVQPRTHSKHSLGRALDMGDAPVGVFAENRHVAVAAVEGDRIDPPRLARMADLARKGQKSSLHGIAFDRPLVVPEGERRIVAMGSGGRKALEVARWRHLALRGIAFAGDLECAVGCLDGCHHHLVSRERTGLVGADHGNRTDRLDRRQTAHDRVAPGHCLHAYGERDRHDGREPFRYCGDGNTDYDHEHFRECVVAHVVAVDEEQASNDEDQECEPPREMIHLLHERRGDLLHVGEKPADPADFRRPPRGDNHAPRGTLGDERAGPQHGPAVAERRIVRDRPHRLVDRNRFTRQHRFLGGKATCLEQAHVGGNLVARLQQHDVARHEIRAVHRHTATVPQDRGMRRQHVADGRHRLLRLAFLDEADHGIGKHDRKDHTGIDPVLEGSRDDGCTEEDVDQHIVELAEKAAQGATSFRRRKPVGTEDSQPTLCLGRGKTTWPGIQSGKAFFRGARMGVRKSALFDRHSSFSSMYSVSLGAKHQCCFGRASSKAPAPDTAVDPASLSPEAAFRDAGENPRDPHPIPATPCRYRLPEDRRP